MKKLLGSTLALALLVPAGANAELLKNFKVSGSLDVSAVSANNVSDFRTDNYDHTDVTQSRLLVHGDWDLLDDVHSHVTLTKNNRTYGSGSESIDGWTANIVADQAYVKIDKLFGALDTTVGRQFYGEAGDMVIYFGPRSDYGLSVTALDGARFDWNGEKVGVTALFSKQAGASTLASGSDSGDVNLHGVDVHVKATDNMSGSAYAYSQTTVNSGGGVAPGKVADDHLYVAGLKAKVTMGGAWLKAEFAKNFGENRTGVAADGSYAFTGNYTGWAGKVNGGIKADLNNLGAITGWGEAGIGSGGSTSNRNFQAIAGDYRPGGIYGRFQGSSSSAQLNSAGAGAINGSTLSDRVIIGAGVKLTPAALSKLTAGLSWWNFRSQSAAGTVATAASGSKQLGNEYDLDLSWAHSENVTVGLGAGQFVPGRAVNVANNGTGGPINPAHLCYTDLSVKF